MLVLEVTQDCLNITDLFKYTDVREASAKENTGLVREVKEGEYPLPGFLWLMELPGRLKVYKANFIDTI